MSARRSRDQHKQNKKKSVSARSQVKITIETTHVVLYMEKVLQLNITTTHPNKARELFNFLIHHSLCMYSCLVHDNYDNQYINILCAPRVYVYIAHQKWKLKDERDYCP